MKDYLVYHNPDVMGSELTPTSSDHHSIVTNKTLADPRGCRVWLLTGRGSPRTFFLHSYFYVDDIETATDDRFKTRLSGNGHGFDPMPILNGEDWFDDFKQTQGNFAFGLQAITKPRFIEGLETLANRD